jgi:hypothetical protein
MNPVEEPLGYQTSVEETADGQFEVIVTTVFSDGGRRAEVGVHPNRAKAELAARLIDKSAKRYLGVGDSRKDAPTFANPELS